MIKIIRYENLDFKTKLEIENLKHDEFGNFSIVNEIEWSKPHWTIAYYEKNELAAFYNVITRCVNLDNYLVKTAGINNLITVKKFRGKGFASKLLRETEYFLFQKLNCQICLLLCSKKLVSFYERLNWDVLDDCSTYFDQVQGTKLWKAETMLRTKNEKLNPRIINLNGLPW